METPKSIPEQLYHDHEAGLIKTQDYHILTADWTADNLKLYPPIEYSALHPDLEGYMTQRLARRVQKDQDKSSAVKQWLMENNNRLLENEKNISLMAWCKEKLVLGQLYEKHQNVESHKCKIERLRYPSKDMQRAKWCAERDSE